jgi:hypothetical protein
VRRAGDRIRVTAQLIAAADGTNSWSERYDRPMIDVFAMQDEIASAITDALKGKLGRERASPRHYTPRLPAYESFLRGRAHLAQFTLDASNRAKGLFEQASALDLLTSDLDAAADWYGRMIEHRDPFALVYARASVVEPVRGHPCWPELAVRMKLPAMAT